MASSDYFLGGVIKHIGMAHGLLEAKEDTGTSMDIHLGGAMGGGQNIHTGTKDAKVGKVDTASGAHGDGGLGAITTWEAVSNENKIDQSVGPKLGFKIGSKKTRANAISNGAMGTLDLTHFTG